MTSIDSNTAESSSSSLWESYFVSDDSWLPLFLPLTMWMSVWCYVTLWKGEVHAKYYKWLTFHHVAALVMASISLYYKDNSIWNERVGILWTLGFYVADTCDCIYMKDLTYGFHGVACLALGLANYNIPLLFDLRMNSKATFIELSSPFMYLARATRDPVLFVLFGLVFTCCRIIYIPFLYKELVDNGLHPTRSWVLLALFSFYLLNLGWWVKIIKIVVSHKKTSKGEKEDSNNKDEEKNGTKKEE